MCSSDLTPAEGRTEGHYNPNLAVCMTDVLRVSATDPEAEPIARAAHCIRNGGLVAFPTETVYGLGAHALDHRAVARIFAAKGRPSTDPLIVHVLNLEAAAPLVADPPATLRVLAERYWPGPLTLIVPRSAAVPDAVTAGRHTVALRSPAHPVARALLRASAVPIAAPSANLFSHPSPTSAAHVLHDLGGRVDIVLDGGSTQVGVESTIVDLSTDPPELLRPGAIGLAELQRLIPTLVSRTVRAAGDVALASPGTLARHYSPRTPLRLFDGSRHEALDGIARAVATAQGAHRREIGRAHV